MKKFSAFALLLLLALACGGQQAEEPVADVTDEQVTPPAQEEYVLPEADQYITIRDSIGVELGDSNYVFGQLAGADITPEGNLAILDLQKTCISIFNPRGDFLTRIGRQGSGPGEFQMPAGMTFFPLSEDDGEGLPGCAVCDAMGGKIVYFDRELEYMTNVQGFFPSPPAVLVGVRDGAIVGMKPEFEQNEEGMFMGFTIGRWEFGETSPSVVYFESMSPFDPSDLSTMQDDIVSFGANPEGYVLTAPLATDRYTFTLWTPEGQEIFTYLEEDYQRVPKTQEEIDLETEMVNNRMVQQGMPEGMANWEPDPYRTAVAGLWFDARDRIWVTRGTTVTPSFDVFDMEGSLLFTAALDAGEKASTWQAMIQEDRLIAFDVDPELYPQVFIADLPGFDMPEEELEGSI